MRTKSPALLKLPSRPSAIFLALAVIGATMLGPNTTRATQVWLGPQSPNLSGRGAADWDELFRANTGWPALASRIQVLLVTEGYVTSRNDHELRRAWASLKSSGIGLAIGLQSIAKVPGENCGGQEGYGSPAESRATAEKLFRLGIHLSYLELDEPLWFGHYDKGPTACQLSVKEIARRTAMTVKEYIKYFPSVKVGTVEPIPGLMEQPNWRQNLTELQSGIEGRIGRPLAFLHTDVNWSLPHWASALMTLEKYARGHGLAFGVIYDGDSSDKTNHSWTQAVRRHIDELEGGHLLSPDHALFYSWNKYPEDILPIRSDATLGGLVHYYEQQKSTIEARFVPAGVQGALTGGDGRPISDAPITLELIGTDESQPPEIRSALGVVPRRARFAIIGIRINAECYCRGRNNLIMGPIHYSEENGGSVQRIIRVRSIAANAREQGKAKLASLATIAGEPMLRLNVASQQKFGFNSPTFAVTPGAHFSFRVRLGAVKDSGLFGTITVIWLDQKKHGLFRTDIILPQDRKKIAVAITNSAGQFYFPKETLPDLDGRDLRFDFPGSGRLRGTVAYLHDACAHDTTVCPW